MFNHYHDVTFKRTFGPSLHNDRPQIQRTLDRDDASYSRKIKANVKNEKKRSDNGAIQCGVW